MRIRHLGSDDDLLRQVADIFTAQGQHDLESMARALTQDDAYQLARRAHRLGGSAEYLGGTDLSALCAEIEDLAHAGDLTGCRARLPAVEDEYRRIVDELRRGNRDEPGEAPRAAP